MEEDLKGNISVPIEYGVLKSKIPLLYGKPSDKSVITPMDWIKFLSKIKGLKVPKLPNHCVLSFRYMGVERYLKNKYKPIKIDFFGKHHIIYIFKYEDMSVSFAHLPVGAASAGCRLEEIATLGAEYIVFFGDVGVLDPSIKRGEIILPVKALRDEGTSFHYQKPSRYSHPSKVVVEAIKETLREHGVQFYEGGTWTTDAPYRETLQKINEFQKEDIIAVDMEASALFSIAKFKSAHIGAIFYGGDCIAGEKWDPRREKKDDRRLKMGRKKLLDYSLETLYIIHKKNKAK